MILITEFAGVIGKVFDRGLTWTHQIFTPDGAEQNPEDEIGDFFQREAVRNSKRQSQDDSSRRFKFLNSEEEEKFMDEPLEDDFSSMVGPRRQSTSAFGRRSISNEDNNDIARIQTTALARMKSNQFKSPNNKRSVASSFKIKLLDRGKSTTGLKLKAMASTDRNKAVQLRRLQSASGVENMVTSKTTMVKRDHWKMHKFQQDEHRIYIKEYKASPLEMEVSVMHKATYAG